MAGEKTAAGPQASRRHRAIVDLWVIAGLAFAAFAILAAADGFERFAAWSRAHQRLEGILPICSFCKRIRDDDGTWTAVESYVRRHSAAEFSHGFCDECGAAHYPDEGARAPDVIP